MPNQVYRLDPVTRRVSVIATDFVRCNGIALSEDGKLAYMYVFLFFFFNPYNPPHLGLHRVANHRTDSGAVGGILGNNQTEPATMQV